MSAQSITVTNAAELADALQAQVPHIIIEGNITGSPSITLPAGTTLEGANAAATLTFTAKGVRLTKDNQVKNLTISTQDYETAIYNATDISDAGTLRLTNVVTDGQVLLLAEDALKQIRVETDGVHVRSADVRGRAAQPHAYGVDVLQGGITLWNRQADASTTFTATLRGLRVGTSETPVRGSGVFVGGYADRDGKLAGGAFTADLIETLSVETDGGIAPGTPDKITAGVFVASGAQVEAVVNNGAVTTHGQNDMVLDNWGDVTKWTANDTIRSTGPSGIGFVNFGNLGTLEVNAPIITEGKGARGFNLYDGTLESATFDAITTTGDGSIGIQVSKPLGTLTVRGDVETTGGEGLSLVRGVQMTLQAIAVSVKSGAHIGTLTVDGAIRTRGAGITAFEVLEGAVIDSFSAGTIEALGDGAQAEVVEGSIN